MIIAMFLGLAGGLAIGFAFDITYPTGLSFYITMGILAMLDSLIGAARANLMGNYDNLVFISGFVINAVLAGLLTFLGDKLGVPLYYAAILVFGGRLFNNSAVIRRILLDKYFLKKNHNIDD